MHNCLPDFLRGGTTIHPVVKPHIQTLFFSITPPINQMSEPVASVSKTFLKFILITLLLHHFLLSCIMAVAYKDCGPTPVHPPHLSGSPSMTQSIRVTSLITTCHSSKVKPTPLINVHRPFMIPAHNSPHVLWSHRVPCGSECITPVLTPPSRTFSLPQRVFPLRNHP